jgi:ornithine carbamoyltransferase
MINHLLSINDLSTTQILRILELGDAYRNHNAVGLPLSGRTIAMLFEKPSLRTRVSFDVGIQELGGASIYLGKEEVGLDTRESAEDIARILSGWVSAMVCRVFEHSTLERMAANSLVPVINALSDLEHPCQALADLLTIRQHLKDFPHVTVAFLGDANNCALSLGLACASLGIQFRIASPKGYGFSADTLQHINNRYQESGKNTETTSSPVEAVSGVNVIYTDVWTSMGQEADASTRRQHFDGFQVNEELLSYAPDDVILMHPMPAHYGEEVAHGILRHRCSVAFDQAENRLYAQKAVFDLLFTEKG